MISENKSKQIICLYIVLNTIVFCTPYLFCSGVQIRHDTLFHLGRIAMLAEGIRHGDLVPLVYPEANFGYGYGSPMFYCNIPNYPFALLNAIGVPLAVCYKAEVVFYTFLSCTSMAHLVYSITETKDGWFRTWATLIGTSAYLFSNYRISDVFVRSALGEIVAFAVLPWVIEETWRIVYKRENHWLRFGTSLALLAFAHNISFILGVLVVVLMVLTNLRQLNKQTWITLLKGMVTGFLLSIPYTIPMLEQMSAQPLVGSTYNDASSLASYSMRFLQFFANKTSYDLAGKDIKNPMLTNVGWLLTFAPISYVFARKKDKFVTWCMAVGYVFMILPWDVFPWQYMNFMAWIQFPWRLNIIAISLLSIPTAYALTSLLYPHKWHTLTTTLLLCAVTAGGFWHTSMGIVETWGPFKNTDTWEDVRSDKILTPDAEYDYSYCCSESQGGEYLPLNHPNLKKRSNMATDTSDTVIPYSSTGRAYGVVEINLPDSYRGVVEAPLLWYKGYRITYSGSGKEVLVERISDGLVSFRSLGAGTYTITFHRTNLGKICDVIFGLTVCALLLIEAQKKSHQRTS